MLKKKDLLVTRQTVEIFGSGFLYFSRSETGVFSTALNTAVVMHKNATNAKIATSPCRRIFV
jgi:hypothetical protein